MEMYLLSLIFCFALHPLAQVFVKAEAANQCQWQGAGENYFGHCWDLLQPLYHFVLPPL